MIMERKLIVILLFICGINLTLNFLNALASSAMQNKIYDKLGDPVQCYIHHDQNLEKDQGNNEIVYD